MVTKTSNLLKSMKEQKFTAIAGTSKEGIYIPNHSGDLSAGKVLTNPTQDLNVVNKKFVDDSFLRNDGDTATGNYNFDSNTFVIDAANNKIGIGTASPAQQVEISKDISAGATGTYLQVTSASDGNNIKMGVYYPTSYHGEAGIWLNQSSPTDTNYAFMQDIGYTMFNAPSGGYMVFRIANGTKMIITPTAGYVGIGTNSPNEKLEVNGKIRANTAFNINGTDGVSGTFTTVDLKTVTVTNGIITSIV